MLEVARARQVSNQIENAKLWSSPVVLATSIACRGTSKCTAVLKDMPGVVFWNMGAYALSILKCILHIF
jgi:hypothetical protein